MENPFEGLESALVGNGQFAEEDIAEVKDIAHKVAEMAALLYQAKMAGQAGDGLKALALNLTLTAELAALGQREALKIITVMLGLLVGAAEWAGEKKLVQEFEEFLKEQAGNK